MARRLMEMGKLAQRNMVTGVQLCSVDGELIKSADPEELLAGGHIKDIISDATEDRHGDIVAVNGWDLKNYKKNPVVLWAHSHDVPPIGKCIKIWKAKSPAALKAISEYPSADVYEFANTTFRLSALGYIKATSVGFIPKEGEPIDEDHPWDGWSITKQELTEFSRVPVPANPNSLQCAANEVAGFRLVKDWAEMILDTGDKEKEMAEAHGKLVGNKTSIVLDGVTYEPVEPEKSKARSFAEEVLEIVKPQIAELMDKVNKDINETADAEDSIELVDEDGKAVEFTKEDLHTMTAQIMTAHTGQLVDDMEV